MMIDKETDKRTDSHGQRESIHVQLHPAIPDVKGPTNLIYYSRIPEMTSRDQGLAFVIGGIPLFLGPGFNCILKCILPCHPNFLDGSKFPHGESNTDNG